MTPEDCASTVNLPVNLFGTKWMFEPQTYAEAGTLGFGVMDFYLCGRAGAVPGIDAALAHDVLGIFDRALVEENWEAGESRQPLEQTARMWADACAEAGRRHLPDDERTARLAELAARVVAEAEADDAPVFVAWREMDVPADVPAAAAHQLNALRELRGGVHLAELSAAGVSIYASVAWRAGPDMAKLFGHGDPLPEMSDTDKQRWHAAEDATNARVAEAFGALSEEERDEFASLVADLLT